MRNLTLLAFAANLLPLIKLPAEHTNQDKMPVYTPRSLMEILDEPYHQSCRLIPVEELPNDLLKEAMELFRVQSEKKGWKAYPQEEFEKTLKLL